MKSLLLGCLMVACASPAWAASNEIPFEPDLTGQTVKCTDFKANPDGTWTTVHAIGVQRMNEYATVAGDTTFKAGGAKTVGLDIGAMLDKVCPR